jgi:hypothetical protein
MSLLIVAAAATWSFALAAVAYATGGGFIGPFTGFTTLTSTVPANGDVNPYGIVTVPRSTGKLVAGDLLISNFNNSGNQQGTGTTIDEIPPTTVDNPPLSAPTFATIDANHLPGPCPGGVGLTTALSALPSGFVIVGSLPTSDGMSDTAAAGCLLVLNNEGRVVETIAGAPIDGPWDMTAVSDGFITTLFVTNVLPRVSATQADTATVVRIRLLTLPGIPPIPFDEDVIGTGFPARTDPTALVIGPTGVALGDRGTLFVADTLGNRIGAIPSAMFRDRPFGHGGITVSSGGFLNGPLGMTLAPNGDILTANGGDGFIVETTPGGTQVAEQNADATPGGSAGTLFGLTVPPGTNGVYYVDDGDNTLRLLH